MRTKLGVDGVTIQFGTVTVTPPVAGVGTTVAIDPAISGTIACVSTPRANVSLFTGISGGNATFETSDTAAVTCDYIIASSD